ncbi:MAG: DUF1592 domain-containing protein [Pirellulaceae bacterium]|nr:DUF1592 domain-containing protein [Pirellulaceae bacterium]
MKLPWVAVLVTVCLIASERAWGQASGEAQPDPFLQAHCADCHWGEQAEAGLDLSRLASDLSDGDAMARWVRIHDRVARGEMPPAEADQPDADERRRYLAALGKSLTSADLGRREVLLRRLNRVEYEHTVCDLFGIRVELKSMLPEDPTAHGFDTIGDVLAISPEQLEVYLQAADKALDQVFGSERPPKRVDIRMPLGRDPFASRSIGRLFVKTDDDSLVTFQGGWCPSVFNSGQATVNGTYRVKIHARTFQTDQPLVMAVYGGDVIVGRGPSHLVGYYDIPPGDEWTVVEFEDYLEARGAYQMKPYQLSAPTQGPNRFTGPGLMIGEVEVVGPLEAWPPTSRVQLLGDVDPERATIEDARRIFLRLLPRAFRRPVTDDEAETYVALSAAALDQGRPFLAALRVGLQAALCSPEFLLREEPVDDIAGRDLRAISPHALASRLSYFLWSSLPDEQLSAAAATGRLTEPDELRRQVERMLRDPKSQRFVENFTGQWLDLRQIDFTEPDMRQYPEFDEMLRYSLVEETHRFFREMLERDLPVANFVDSDWSILNERLARHYGIEGVTGTRFRRVALPEDSVRGGVMTQASVLKVTANGTNTSPVVRGAWVLDRILGQPVPPPPPGVSAIEPDIRGATTIREQLDKHRNDPSCASCHARMDPLGFALESFDVIGGWRTWYRTLGEGPPVNLEYNRRRVQYRRGPDVDCTGQLPDGRPFADIRQVKRLMLADQRQIARCLCEKLLTYGLGRQLGFSDRPAVDALVAATEDRHHGLRSLVHEIVLSDLFRSK